MNDVIFDECIFEFTYTNKCVFEDVKDVHCSFIRNRINSNIDMMVTGNNPFNYMDMIGSSDSNKENFELDVYEELDDDI